MKEHQTPPGRGHWRLQLSVVTLPQRKMHISIMAFRSGHAESIDNDELVYLCPAVVPKQFQPGCRSPIPPDLNQEFFVCPSCGLTGPQEILGEQIMMLNTTSQNAAKLVHDVWVQCGRDADFYLSRQKSSQRKLREAAKDRKEGALIDARERVEQSTEKVIYRYDSLMRDAIAGDVVSRIKAFLEA